MFGAVFLGFFLPLFTAPDQPSLSKFVFQDRWSKLMFCIYPQIGCSTVLRTLAIFDDYHGESTTFRLQEVGSSADLSVFNKLCWGFELLNRRLLQVMQVTCNRLRFNVLNTNGYIDFDYWHQNNKICTVFNRTIHLQAMSSTWRIFLPEDQTSAEGTHLYFVCAEVSSHYTFLQLRNI